ncbi:hypothetical protein AGR1B_Cc120195 [Agrobacterium fabacearum S56]|nr:hypothetical protein AGR1C_Cc10626 [Agrobacterium fabacearum TT111]CUW88898.1 hypothetical protein AGR1B_Cc120195 [Agrobacterium fabacearum S56]
MFWTWSRVNDRQTPQMQAIYRAQGFATAPFAAAQGRFVVVKQHMRLIQYKGLYCTLSARPVRPVGTCHDGISSHSQNCDRCSADACSVASGRRESLRCR